MALWQFELCFGMNNTDNGWREMITWSGDGDGPFWGTSGLRNWMNARLPFLAMDCYIFAATRRQIDGASKSAITVKFPDNFGGAGLPSNLAGDCIDYNAWSANNENRRLFTFRGIPDSWVETGHLTPAGVDGIAAIDAYFVWLKGANAAIRVADEDNPWTPIQIISPSNLTGPGYDLKIVTADGTAASVQYGSTIKVKGLTGFPYINGIWLAGSPTATSFTLRGSKRYYIATTDTGMWQLFVPASDAIVSTSFTACGTRDTGKKPFLPRGRRSARVLHR